MKREIVVWLQSIDILRDVPVPQLEWLGEHLSERKLKVGERLFEAGQVVDGTHFVKEGSFRICVRQMHGLKEVMTFGPGGISGYLPFSRGRTFQGIGDVTEDMTYYFLPIECSVEMIKSQFELTQALVHSMADRIRVYTSLQLQNEKMMAFGKLSAGIAHELNNPASAVVRGSDLLIQSVVASSEMCRGLLEARVEGSDLKFVNLLLAGARLRRINFKPTMMEASDLEDKLVGWLEQHQYHELAGIAATLVDFTFTVDDLEILSGRFNREVFPVVMRWLANGLFIEQVSAEVGVASRQIATLVGSVKRFTYMDKQGERQLTNIHEDIRNTLVMLGYKLKNGHIAVEELFDKDVPPVLIMPGEMNQVWINLIDNAIDAMETNSSGKLQIKTVRVNDHVRVSVTDNGVGIPQSDVSRIFDPFFTTKEVGKGTGLGLDIVRNIVQQHQGTVRLTAEPGKTSFIVEFPIA
jgi:signal transduction histidine kinase